MNLARIAGTGQGVRGRIGRQRALLAALVIAAVWSAGLLLVGGCTSDPLSAVGSGLVDDRIDSTLLELKMVTIDAFSGIQVDDDAVSLVEQQTVYMGTEANTQASLLINFDFGDIVSDDYPLELFDRDNIQTVKLSLTKLLPYSARKDSVLYDEITGEVDTIYRVPTGQPLDLRYFVFELQAPFDSLTYTTYPAAVPSYNGAALNSDFTESKEGEEPTLSLYVDDLVRWVTTGAEVGIMVQLGDQSDPGLVGFASRDLKSTYYSEIPVVAVGTIPGPNLIVTFEAGADPLLIRSDADVTAYEQVDTAPTTVAEAADRFILRTGLRSYPAIRYSLDALPPNAIVNRAVLTVTNDNSTGYGPEFSVVVSEIVDTVMDNTDRRLDVSGLKDERDVYTLEFRDNLRPDVDQVIEFDVTEALQRAVNGVTAETRGLILTGVETKVPFLGTRRIPPDVTLPGFYYRQMNFRGLADPDPASRPFLRVWYSVINDLTGGGE